MSEQTTLSAIGLHTSENELGAVPQGGLVKAQNCVVLAPGLIGSRRGQAALDYAPSDTPNAVAVYQDEMIWQTGASGLERDTGSAFAPYAGTHEPASSSQRMRFLEAQDNLYFATAEGVKRLDSLDGTPALAGGPKTWGLRLSSMLDSPDGFLAAGESAAYRVVFGTKDANGTVHLGAPSNRLVVTNEGAAGIAATGTLTLDNASGVVGGTIGGTTVTVTWATSDNATAIALAGAINANGTLSPDFTATAVNNVVTITCDTVGAAGNGTSLTATGTGATASGATFSGGADSGSPQNVAVSIVLAGAWTTETFWQLYRTVSFPADVLPGDEMYLVREGYFSLNEVGETGLVVTDTTPSSFVAAQTPLYTNSARGEGILQENDPPPYCTDIAWWDNRAWYANTRQPEQVVLTVIGCGVGENGETGIRPGDVLTIGSDSLIAAENESIVDGTFKLFTDGLPSENRLRTVESLCYVINQRTGYRASSLASVDDGSEGRLLIEAEDLTTTAFNMTVKPLKYLLLSLIGVDGGVGLGTTLEAHNLQVGDTISLESSNPDADFPVGVKTITRVPTATTFWYEDIAIPFGATATGTYTEIRLTPPAQSAWRPAPPTDVFDVYADGLVRVGSTVTVTTTSAHGLSIGMEVPLVCDTTPDAAFPVGTKTVASVPTTTTFTYAEAGAATTSTVAYRSGSRVTSDSYERPAGLSRSKLQEPEAVPAVANSEQIGALDKRILRIVPLRQNLFVIKEEGVYIISGSGGEYRFDPLDLTVHVYSPDSVTVVRDRIFALSNQGVVAITPNGVQVVSRPIEQELLQYFGPTLSDVRVDSFGVGHETERLYSLWLPALSGASEAPYNAPRAYVYSVTADAWTTWELARTCGIVRASDDALYMGDDAPAVYLESNTKTASDYADGSATDAVLDWNESTLTMTVADTSDYAVGDGVVQGATTAIVAAIPDGTTITLSSGGFTENGNAATGYFQFNSASGTVTATIDGTDIFVSAGGDDAVDAANLASAITSASESLGVSALAVGGRVNLTANTPGLSGNAITLAAAGTGLSVSGATLTGGTSASVSVYRAIPIDLEWRTFAANSPADVKKWQAMHLHFRQRDFYKGTLILASDIVSTEETINVTPNGAAYSPDPDTYPGMPVRPKKTWVGEPREHAQAAYLSVAWRISEAFALWWLNGLTLVYETISPKGQR